MGGVKLNNYSDELTYGDNLFCVTMEVKPGEIVGTLNNYFFIDFLSGEETRRKNDYSLKDKKIIQGPFSCIRLYEILKDENWNKISTKIVKDFIAEEYRNSPNKITEENRANSLISEFGLEVVKNEQLRVITKLELLKVYFVKALLNNAENVFISLKFSDVLFDRKLFEEALNILAKKHNIAVIIDFKYANQALRVCDKVAVFSDDHAETELLIFDVPEKVVRSTNKSLRKFLLDNYVI